MPRAVELHLAMHSRVTSGYTMKKANSLEPTLQLALSASNQQVFW
jgi:hypothetical protein